jgi:hypothetical protein
MCAKKRRKFMRDIKKRGVIMTAPAKTPAKRGKRGKRTGLPAPAPAPAEVVEFDPNLSITNHHFVTARLDDLFEYMRSVVGENDKKFQEQCYAAMASVWGMSPKDHAEARLLVQMHVTHDAAIRALTQVGRSNSFRQTQTFGNLATKLLRTYQGQMETLARMRRSGEQVIRHIHVDNRGGQAVIADNVQIRGHENEKVDDQSHATQTIGSGTALPSADTFGNGMPIAGCEGQAEMQDARRHQSGAAPRQPKRTDARRSLCRDAGDDTPPQRHRTDGINAPIAKS